MKERINTDITKKGFLEGEALTGPYREMKEGEVIDPSHILMGTNSDVRLIPIRIYGNGNGGVKND